MCSHVLVELPAGLEAEGALVHGADLRAGPGVGLHVGSQVIHRGKLLPTLLTLETCINKCYC